MKSTDLVPAFFVQWLRRILSSHDGFAFLTWPLFGMANQRYLVTARKYRPALFKELVAQDHVSDTLKNALRLDRLAHAYLFSGPRGVGKTTTARILAKAINCETAFDEREDGAEPCRTCASCQAFEDGRSLNVFEMDAASNNKVDDIRELREKVRIPPQGSARKVYILDEVHMLSKSAFNALLKTLEEPPPHALFIFATTEPHKVLDTILSRCQRFDFRRIPPQEIVGHLRDICAKEGIEADEKSLMLIARKGNGALRDALSAFDQAISLCGTTLTYGDLTQALGVVDQDLYFQLTRHVRDRNSGGVLQLVHHIVRNGYDLQEFLAGVSEHLRNMLVTQALGPDALEDVADSTRAQYTEHAQHFREPDLLRLLTLAGDAEQDVKSSAQPRLKLEMTLLKMAQIRHTADLQRVLQKLNRLETMVDTGKLPERLPKAPSADADLASDASPSEGSPSSAAPTAPHDSGASNTASSNTALSTTGTAEADSSSASASSNTPSDDADPSDTPPPPEPHVSTPPDETADDASSSPDDSAAPDPETSDPETGTRPSQGATRDAGPDDTADDTSTTAPPADESESSTTDDHDQDPPSSGGRSSSDPSQPDASQEGLIPDLFGTPALQETPEPAADRPDDESNENTPSNASASPAGSSASSAAPSERPRSGSATLTSSAPAPPGDERSSHGDNVATPPSTLSESEWNRFVARVREKSHALWGILSDASPKSIVGDTLTIAVTQRFARDRVRDRQTLLCRCINTVVDTGIERVDVVIETPDTSDTDTSASHDPRERVHALRDTYPALDVLLSTFDAEPMWS